jgi:hypothetical protein
LDYQRPRILTFGPDLEQLWREYYEECELAELTEVDVKQFITGIRDKCVWNDKGWDQFHHPLHYITFDPGDIWFFNAQWITHQVVFGSKLQCYEADIVRESLQKPDMCLKDRIVALQETLQVQPDE